MMKSKRVICSLLSVEALICLVAALALPGGAKPDTAALLSVPFSQAGSLLRSLSLSGHTGNALALSVYLILGILPLSYLILLIKRKKAGAEDILLPLLSVLLYFVLYLMINPGLIRDWLYHDAVDATAMIPFGKAALGDTVYSVLISYLVLKAMRNIEGRSPDRFLDMARILLAVAAVVLVFSIFFAGVRGFAAAIHDVKSANDSDGAVLTPTYIFLFIGFLVNQLPTVIATLLFIQATGLAEAIKADRYGEAALLAAERLSRTGRNGVIATVAATMGFNLLQLLFSRWLHAAHYSTRLPLGAIILTLVMVLLGRYISDSSRLHRENQMFI